MGFHRPDLSASRDTIYRIAKRTRDRAGKLPFVLTKNENDDRVKATMKILWSAIVNSDGDDSGVQIVQLS